MYRSILAATDGSKLGQAAVAHADALAKAFGARLSIVVVTEQIPAIDLVDDGALISASVFDEVRRAQSARGHAVLDAAVKSCGGKAEPIYAEQLNAWRGVLDAASQCGADLIVMGSHGHRGIERIIMGSQAQKVLSLSPVSVLIVKA